MKKAILILLHLPFLLSSFSLMAQDKKVEEELRVLYAEENYLKCAAKAEKYMEKDDHDDDPVVYIYASMACLRISQTHEMSEEFPKAFKDALSYAQKYRKKDKSGAYYKQYISHFEEIKRIVTEEVENYLLNDDKQKIYRTMKKSVSLVKKIVKMDPTDKGAALMYAFLQIGAQNPMEGKAVLKKELPLIKQIRLYRSQMEEFVPDPKMADKKDPIYPPKALEEMSEMEQVNLRVALMRYADYMYEKGKIAEAKELIEIGKPLFYEENDVYVLEYDTRYKAIYDKING